LSNQAKNDLIQKITYGAPSSVDHIVEFTFVCEENRIAHMCPKEEQSRKREHERVVVKVMPILGGLVGFCLLEDEGSDALMIELVVVDIGVNAAQLREHLGLHAAAKANNSFFFRLEEDGRIIIAPKIGVYCSRP
jgi:hypothetical protein